MLYTEGLPICKTTFSFCASFFPELVVFFCHFVFHLLFSHHLLTSLPLPLTHANAPEYMNALVLY